MNILLAVDGSEASTAAITLLQRLPFTPPTSVTVIGVLEEGPLAKLERFLAPGESEHFANWQGEARERIKSVVAAACETLGGTWPCTPCIRAGNVAEEVLEQAAESKADLIVLGTAASKPLVSFTQGGKRQKIISHAPCSVLIARPQPVEPAADAPFKILLAYDGSPQAELAAAQLRQLQLARLDVEILSVLTVATKLYGHDILERLKESWQAYKRECEQALTRMTAELQGVAGRVHAQLVDGGAAPEDDLLEHAEQHHVDLIMLGATGRSGLQRFFLGSVASRVAQHAPCAVWVARERV